MSSATETAQTTRQDMGLKKVAFTMYPVTEMVRARDFYENILGLAPGSVVGNNGWVEYDLPGGGCFALTTFMQGVVPSASAGGCIAFEVEDIKGLVAALKAKGVKVAAEGIESPVCDMAVIHDSEGNQILLHQLKPKA